MNTKLRTEGKNEFDKDFFKLMDNIIFGNTMENVRKYNEIKLLKTEKRRNYLVSEPKFAYNRNEKNPNNHKKASSLRFIDIKFK